jgi:hypothetical protein
MGDEALEAVLGDRQYTAELYRRLLEATRAKADELNGGGGGGAAWSARDVERCLFAAAIAAAPRGKPGGGKKSKADAPAGAAEAKKRKR